ncbi:TPA: aminotransferase [bacterium]|nr:aminotransferase [bacterium]
MKKILMTPGPTMIPEDVLLEMAEPIIHHRTKEFQEVLKDVEEGLKYVFQTKNPVFIFASSGTGGMEACVCNVLSSTDRALVIVAGKFGERWLELCKAYKVPCEVLDIPEGDAPDPEDIRKILQKEKINAVFSTLCETSSGVVSDIEAIGKICKEYETMLIIDAISGLCADPFFMDDWNVDVCVSGSQKGLMMPPGLSFVAVSKKALDESEKKSDLPKYYFSFKKANKALEKTDTPFTPAISLIKGLSVALERIKKEGLPNVIERHNKLAQATRASISALGLSLFAKRPSNALTSVRIPEGIEVSKLYNRMRDIYGVNIAKGQGELEDKIFRIAHLGYVEIFDIITTISALEMTLSDLGFSINFGDGVSEVEKAFKR